MSKMRVLSTFCIVEMCRFLMSKLFFTGTVWNWSIKNKYYSSKVKIHQRKLDDKVASKVSNIGASIWYSSEFKYSDVDFLKSWQEELSSISEPKETEPEVQLIIVDHFDTEDTKTAVNKWSIQNSVELIDYSEDENEETEQNVAIFASSAQKRVVESLQTVMWPQLCDSSSNDEEQDKGQNPKEKDLEDFESLFANLVHFKETATGLPDQDRRKFAEKVAMSFFNALGDEGEDSD